MIKRATDETLVGLERIQEPSEEELDDVIETDEEGVEADAPDNEEAAGAEEAQQD
ncbi:hypothetical protein D9M71_387470 [compost metagenome]